MGMTSRPSSSPARNKQNPSEPQGSTSGCDLSGTCANCGRLDRDSALGRSIERDQKWTARSGLLRDHTVVERRAQCSGEHERGRRQQSDTAGTVTTRAPRGAIRTRLPRGTTPTILCIALCRRHWGRCVRGRCARGRRARGIVGGRLLLAAGAMLTRCVTAQQSHDTRHRGSHRRDLKAHQHRDHSQQRRQVWPAEPVAERHERAGHTNMLKQAVPSGKSSPCL